MLKPRHREQVWTDCALYANRRLASLSPRKNKRIILDVQDIDHYYFVLQMEIESHI